MPHKLPEEISQIIKAKIPPTHKMWWIRGIVLGAGQFQVPNKAMPQAPPKIMTRVQVGDVDAPGEGYDAVLEGTGYEFAEGDLISLFGHEPVEAGSISEPKFLLHHNTGTYSRAYPYIQNDPSQWRTLVEYKHWLAIETPASPIDKLKKYGIIGVVFLFFFPFVGGDPGIAFVLILLGAMMLMVLLGPALLGVFIAKKMVQQTSFTRGEKTVSKANPLGNLKQYVNFTYTDITGLYEDVAIAVNRWIRQHPDPEKGFVVLDRGQGTQGRLPE